jgi:hypothetical protein
MRGWDDIFDFGLNPVLELLLVRDRLVNTFDRGVLIFLRLFA